MVLYTYSVWLVAGSIVIALMATFTGLSLTRGLSALGIGQRQARIVMAAIALGGGIWSMHFVAMLAMRFDTPVSYDLIPTIASALIAILIAGLALLIMHFAPRRPVTIAASGSLLGIGIVVMHYVGLSAIEGCAPAYSYASVALSTLLAIGLGIAAIGIAYHQRTERNILLATAVFGTAVAIVHFTAMGQTRFLAMAGSGADAPRLDNAQIAVLVLLSVFVISGAFLLSGASFMARTPASVAAPVAAPAVAAPPAPVPMSPPPQAEGTPLRLPYEREGRTHLVAVETVMALHAEGHYTTAWLDSGPVFCPWSITQAEERLPPGFMRVHRSWIVNIARVSAYERARDHGYCLFQGSSGLSRVPVSRQKIAAVREALGL
ncbi:MAG: MHYT domain-containing protein [Paracoccaceae bacterium]